MNKSYSQIRKELVLWGSMRDVRQDTISYCTGVSQSQVSKILSGDFKTLSPSVTRVCEYANIQINKKNELILTENLKEAMLDLWDGSKESEKALIRTLKTMKSLIGISCIKN